MDFENIVIRILSNTLGDPKRDYTGSGGWYEFNCPVCAENNGRQDDKFNFAVNVEQLYGHCWKCGYSGKISRIIKTYGGIDDYNEYKRELQILKESRQYSLSDINDDISDIYVDIDLELPHGFTLININDKQCTLPYNYLKQRGLNNEIISKFNIGYVGNYKGKYSNRVVIPSYDIYGELNYWVARDYTGVNKWKILNPQVDKKQVVFNSGMINWYEPVTLVEGPFDHIVVPNSIPLLGKSLDENYLVYKYLVDYCKSVVNIFLDPDALDSAYKMYKLLNNVLPNRIKIIEAPDNYDASDYYKNYGYKGVLELLKKGYKLDEFILTTL